MLMVPPSFAAGLPLFRVLARDARLKSYARWTNRLEFERLSYVISSFFSRGHTQTNAHIISADAAEIMVSAFGSSYILAKRTLLPNTGVIFRLKNYGSITQKKVTNAIYYKLKVLTGFKIYTL